ncbi:MAG: SAM-dependent methyltransferase [Deltaproteobacteria bacterium]|nr:SAM-dependent methyltransferase [Deltaproteobacteria bacterium]
MKSYPGDWENVGRELVAALADGKAQRVNDLAVKAKLVADNWRDRIRKSHNSPEVIENALPYLIRSRMLLLALEKCYLAAATGKKSGKIRFNLINGYIIQKLLFSRHLTRKPASLPWFRFWWPFITQKRILMPLVQAKGIYCFYSRKLIQELAVLIGDRACLEMGAGDGTLSLFLNEEGVRSIATDDYSWKHAIQYPETVERLDAKQALAKHQPKAVICSWPPPGNSFERSAFAVPAVELYIVIGSRYPFASGNWEDYAAQKNFAWEVDEKLSRFVIPPELDSAVLIFRRIA